MQRDASWSLGLRPPAIDPLLIAEGARLDAEPAVEADADDVPAQIQAEKPTDVATEIARVSARIEREATRGVERQRRELLSELTDVVDELDRAIEGARAPADALVLLQGVEMVRDGLLARLAGHGAEPFDALGERFDPERHHAVVVEAVRDARRDGKVTRTFGRGFTMNGDILRPARVAVAKA